MRKSLPKVLLFVCLFIAQTSILKASNLDNLEDKICMDCITAPVLICPSTFFGCPFDSTNPSNTGTPTALPGDPYCPTPIVTYTDVLVTNTPCLKIIHRTWLAEYPPGSASLKLHSQCQQTIILEDKEAPVIENCPADITVDLVNSCSGAATWLLPTATDDCGIQYFITTHYSGSVFPLGVTPVTYTANDWCNQMDTCTFNVTVIGSCCSSFTLNCPSNLSLCVGANMSPTNTGYATATTNDVTCPQPIITYSDDTTAIGICSGSYIIERTWLGTDPSNSAITETCVQTLTLSDTYNPVILNIPPDITVSGTGSGCFAQAFWTAPTASDNCGIASFGSNFPNGTAFAEGSTLIVYTAIDQCGNSATGEFLITVQCNSGCTAVPNLICPNPFTSCPSVGTPDPSITGYAVAFPGDIDCAQPLVNFSDNIINSGPCIGVQTIERTWTASDPQNSNLSSSCIQSISLEDNEAPTITNVPYDITVSGFGNNCQVPVSWSEPLYNDNCGIASWTSSIPNGSTLTEGISTIIYTAEDNCGHTSTASFNITVNCINSCTANPIISGPANYWACPTGSIPNPNESGWATANAGSTDCDPPVIAYSDFILFTGPCAGSKVVERTWTATDPYNGNLSASYVQVISLEDFQAPSFIYCPVDITVNASTSNCQVPVNWSAPIASDNCNAPNLTATDQNGNSIYNGATLSQGLTTVTYTASDNCNNTSQCSFNVMITCAPSCNTAPSISCPSNKVICPGSNSSATVLGWATAYAGSNCPNPNVTYQDIITSTGPCNGEKVINRTWTAGYPSGSNLTSSCVQIINVKDELSPTFTNCPTNIIVNDNTSPVNWVPPYATDFCSIPTVSSSHQPGSYFPVGITTVVYSATDYCGNVNHCSFNVTVLNDNSATISCPDNLYLTCNSSGGAIANWDVPLYEGTCGNCDGGPIQGFVYMGTFNGHQYYCSTSQATWNAANQNCINNGGYLATINDQAENDFLANILTLQSAWIGLSDSQIEGDYVWSNGESSNYTNWYPGQPNNYSNNQDYIEMLNNGLWNDQYNHYSLEYIMELPCSYIQQISGPAEGSFLTGGEYTVSYKLTDACGANSTCSFNIYVDGGLVIDCPIDISVSAPSNSSGVPVSWSEPTVQSCCNNCTGPSGETIQGFVYMGAYGGHHYYCSQQPLTWNSAKSSCEDQGGYLAVINDAQENAFLANLLTTQSAWIGLTDDLSEGNFKWVNGNNLSYSNWYPGQPNNYNNDQDYVELINNGQWNDQYNSYSLEYIMEVPGCLNVIQTGGPESGTILIPGSNHTVTYTATDGCGNVETCSFDINVESVPVTTNYCPSNGKISFNYYIDSVVLGLINNPSGDNGGYGDFTNTCYNVEQDQSYALQLDPGYQGQPDDKVYWKVWIDYNLDGDFEDADEYVAYGCGTNTLSGTIVMPPVLWAGETRMRVIMKPGSYATGPCEIYEYGETEDYCLSIWGTATANSNEDISTRSSSNTLAPILLKGQKEEINIEVFPNPAVDFINVNIDDVKNIESLVVLNSQGQKVRSLTSKNLRNQNVINTLNLNSGMYLLSVRKTDGSAIVRKVMIQK